MSRNGWPGGPDPAASTQVASVQVARAQAARQRGRSPSSDVHFILVPLSVLPVAPSGSQ